MDRAKRKTLLIDARVQVPLLWRVTLYWLLGVTAMGVMVGVQVMLSSDSASADVLVSRTLLAFGPALVASMFVLPMMLFDCVRFSNRWAGPMYRLRGKFKQLADTGACERIEFRKDDFWYELGEQFNRVAERLQEREREVHDESGPARDVAAATL